MTAPAPTRSPAETLENDAVDAGVVAAVAVRALEVGVIVLLGLLIVPPLAILVVLVVVPLLVIALLAGVLMAPYLLYHHLRHPQHGHAARLAQRLRHAGRALLDLAPHRIVAAASTSPAAPPRIDRAGS
jgi:hypothetical protein